jgi:hypothetical protein
MEKNRPLEALRKAHEEEYFARRNQELIEKLRERMERDEEVAELRGDTGLGNEALLRRLAAVGVTHETIAVLNLVPLVQVAWADGAIQPDERDLLVHAAREQGIQPDSPPDRLLQQILTFHPTDEFFDASLEFIGAVLAAMPDDHAADARQNLERLAYRVAHATGGLFGRFWNVAPEERKALSQIAARLEAKSRR